RSVTRETSAHVGRVATRFRISAVVATVAIIAGAVPVTTLRWGYSRLIDSLERTLWRLFKRKVDRDLSLHLNRFVVQDIRPITPAVDCVDSSAHQHGMPTQHAKVFDSSFFADNCRQHDFALDVPDLGHGRILGLHALKQAAGIHV